jgi:hypothetical protein
MAKTPSHSHAQDTAGPVRTISAEEDYEAHVKTYRSFLNIMKWVIVATFVVLIFLYFAVQPHIQPPPTS